MMLLQNHIFQNLKLKKMKFKDWDGKDLKGTWLFTIKKDGFQCRKQGNQVVSKNGNPLHHFPKKLKNSINVF